MFGVSDQFIDNDHQSLHPRDPFRDWDVDVYGSIAQAGWAIDEYPVRDPGIRPITIAMGTSDRSCDLHDWILDELEDIVVILGPV